MFEIAKYNDNGHLKWAVFDTISHCFYCIGIGKKKCEKQAKIWNKEIK